MTRFSITLLLASTVPLVACSVEAEHTAAEPGADTPAPFPRETLLHMMSPAEADALAEERGVRVHASGAFDGFTLFAPINSTKVQLIDLDGKVVHAWETGLAPGAWCYLLDDGTLLHCGRDDDDPRFSGGGIGGVLRRLAPDGTVLWRYVIADDAKQQHHDVEPLPNGNVLVIQWERKSAQEAVARGRHPAAVGKAGLWPDAVLELEPVGADGAKVVWEWHVWDHLVQDVDPALPSYGAIADRPGRIDVNATVEPEDTITEEERKAEEERALAMAAMGYAGGAAPEEADAAKDEQGRPPRPGPVPPDGAPPGNRFDKSGDWLHTNAVAYQPELDLIVLSSPELSEIYVIDHSTTTAEAATSSGGRYGHGGDLLWRWGNPQMHGVGDEADRRLFYQHNPTWVGSADAPHVLVFDNGGGRQDGSGWSEVLELALPFDAARGFTCAPGAACGPDEPAWSYSDPERFFSAFISGAQRLPNGNTLVCSGAGGRIFEVTPAGEIVWDYANPFGGDVNPPEHAGKAPPLALFRATRLARDHPGVRALLAR